MTLFARIMLAVGVVFTLFGSGHVSALEIEMDPGSLLRRLHTDDVGFNTMVLLLEDSEMGAGGSPILTFRITNQGSYGPIGRLAFDAPVLSIDDFGTGFGTSFLGTVVNYNFDSGTKIAVEFGRLPSGVVWQDLGGTYHAGFRVVPEPSSLLLLGIGLSALPLLRRRFV